MSDIRSNETISTNMTWITNTSNDFFLLSRSKIIDFKLRNKKRKKLEIHRLMISKEVLAKSTIPPVGRVTRPRKPFPRPLTNPDVPPSFAPETGFVTTPFTPSTKPFFIRTKNTFKICSFK